MTDPVTDLAAQDAALAPEDRSRLIDLLAVSLHENRLPRWKLRGMRKSSAD